MARQQQLQQTISQPQQQGGGPNRGRKKTTTTSEADKINPLSENHLTILAEEISKLVALTNVSEGRLRKLNTDFDEKITIVLIPIEKKVENHLETLGLLDESSPSPSQQPTKENSREERRRKEKENDPPRGEESTSRSLLNRARGGEKVLFRKRQIPDQAHFQRSLQERRGSRRGQVEQFELCGVTPQWL